MEEQAREELVAFMQELETQPAHVRHVTYLALQLFDGLTELHGLGPHERLLLEGAGYLHDIGHRFDSLEMSHHKESARLIREKRWTHFSPVDVEVMAQVARYHRRAMPAMKHPDFASLPDYEQRIVKILAGLLRMADSLDRNHEQSITGVQVELPQNRILFRLSASGPFMREVQSSYRKSDLAQAVFQRDIVIMVGEEVIEPLPEREGEREESDPDWPPMP